MWWTDGVWLRGPGTGPRDVTGGWAAATDCAGSGPSEKERQKRKAGDGATEKKRDEKPNGKKTGRERSSENGKEENLHEGARRRKEKSIA